jgi:hypothetical protein
MHTSVNLNHLIQTRTKSEYIPYKFKPKLTQKTLQDNPLMLGSIIKKKLRILERKDIDKYLTSIIQSKLIN